MAEKIKNCWQEQQNEQRKLEVAGENSDHIALRWESESMTGACYVLQGLLDSQYFENILTTNKTSVILDKIKNKKYSGFRVLYSLSEEQTGNILFIGVSNILYNCFSKQYTPIAIKFLNSWDNRTAVSFQHEGIYDHYCLYEINGHDKKLILTTDDFIIETNQVVKEKTYLVEGYIFKNDKYILDGCSYPTVFDTFISREAESTVPELSIVIPVYNSELLLPRCIDSIIMSTIPSIEIILVDDGSTDKSSQICAWYKEKYDFINLIHCKNQGVCNARNTGLKYVMGKWMAYMDNDDMIHPYAYKKLYDAAIISNADISIAQGIIRKEHGKHELVINPFVEGEEIISCSLADMILNKGWTKKFWCAVWNKIVKTNVARTIQFPNKDYFPHDNRDIQPYEDEAYTPALYSYVNKFIIIRGAFYVWDRRYRKISNQIPAWKQPTNDSILRNKRLYALMYSADVCKEETRPIVHHYIFSRIHTHFNNYAGKSVYSSNLNTIVELICKADNKYDFAQNEYIRKNKDFLKMLDEIKAIAANRIKKYKISSIAKS